MASIILNLIKGWVTKELLLSIFKDVILETTLDFVTDFVKKTENPYDDKLIENLKEFLKKQ